MGGSPRQEDLGGSRARPWQRRWWASAPLVLVLSLIATAGLGIRVAFAATRGPDTTVYDAAWYDGEAHALAAGQGFEDPAPVLFGMMKDHHRPNADHPPLTALVLTPAAYLFPTHQLALRLTFVLVGTLSIVVIGLLGAAVGGRRTAVIAALLAAVYPFLWVNDGLVMSESIAILLTSASLLVAYRLLRRPTIAGAVALGVLSGLAALTRTELLLLGPAVALGIASSRRAGSARTRVAIAATSVAVAALVITPWVAFNLSRFREPVFITTAGDTNLLASNCDDTFSGAHLGSIGVERCFNPYGRGGDPSVAAESYRHRALQFVRDHLDRFPVVVLARLGRDWSLFRPMQSPVFEGRPDWVVAAGLVFYYPILALAAGGVATLRRRARPWWPLLVPVGIVCLTTLVSWGQNRFRAPAEPGLVVLAAVAVGALLDRRSGSGRVADPDGHHPFRTSSGSRSSGNRPPAT
ncbi:MAG: ArnT family glycosyltransferase [Acidimicrobiia bacterium]